MSTLAVRVDNTLGIACLQDRLRAHKALHADVVAEFKRQIDDLEARLAASTPTTGSSHLAQVIADRDLAIRDRDRAVL
ncbi:hypothetical protein P3T76_006495 [Phytophthora citrophthora]|uniref:Uncharacterized protein n=1 Tax=Phytophthora citrophthora TaxID=4793 RepID=A0AAD9LM60_9STRA|nr:hypothetical protein P3T76_006495 [Phytophthora citrophthora]